MDDLISRQAAIDALAKAMPKLTTPDGCGPFDHEINIACEAFFDCMSIIDELQPAAQPEVIRCKDCKHREVENGFCEGRGWPMQLVPDDGFCDKGERRNEEEDNEQRD